MPPSRQSQILHAPPTAARGTTLPISETFCSRQGEGRLVGTPSFFIRTSGCNLRCWFCDTPYASWQPEGDRVPVDQLVRSALESDLRHVVLTGGEPLLPQESVLLCRELREAGLHVTIETAGTIDRPVASDLISISPKFHSSAPEPTRHPAWNRRHHQRRLAIDTCRALIDRSVDHQLKFVVDSPGDYDELIAIADRIGVAADAVWVMPQGCTVEAIERAAEWLRPWCRERGFQYCDRMQIRWYGNRRRT